MTFGLGLAALRAVKLMGVDYALRVGRPDFFVTSAVGYLKCMELNCCFCGDWGWGAGTWELAAEQRPAWCARKPSTTASPSPYIQHPALSTRLKIARAVGMVVEPAAHRVAVAA